MEAFVGSLRGRGLLQVKDTPHLPADIKLQGIRRAIKLPGGVRGSPQVRASRKQHCALQAVSPAVQTVAEAWGSQLLPPRAAVGTPYYQRRGASPHWEPGNKGAKVIQESMGVPYMPCPQAGHHL